MSESCIVCSYPADTDINAAFLCKRHYDDVRQRQSWGRSYTISDILEQMKVEWSLLLGAGVVQEPEPPEDQRLRADEQPELPGME